MKFKFLVQCSILTLLWSEYSFTMNNISRENQLQSSSLLQELRKEYDLRDYSTLDLNKISAEELSQYGSFSHIRNLEINAKYLCEQDAKSLLKLSALPLQQLRSLKIVGNAQENHTIEQNLSDLFARTSELKELNLSHNHLKAFPTAIYKLRKLELLDLSGNSLLKKLPKALWGFPNLQQVKINAELISESQIPEYIEVLKNEGIVNLLNSYKNKYKLNNDEIEFIRNNLYFCKIISISGCHWNDRSHKWVKPSLKNSTKIVKLKQMSISDALIHYIKGKEHWDAAENLITYGVDIKAAKVNTPDKYGIPLLVKAAESGRLKIVQYLIEHGANIQMRTKFENTALMGASLFGYLDIVKYLVDRGANVNDYNVGGETSLMRAAGQKHLDIVKYLLERGANVNSQDRFGGTALMKSAYYGSLNIVRYLIGHGADITARDDSKNTILIRAVLEGQLNIVECLIDHGANVNDQNKYGETALIKAVKEGQINMIKCLMDHGADIDISDDSGRTALDFVRELFEKAQDEDKIRYREAKELLENYRGRSW